MDISLKGKVPTARTLEEANQLIKALQPEQGAHGIWQASDQRPKEYRLICPCA